MSTATLELEAAPSTLTEDQITEEAVVSRLLPWAGLTTGVATPDEKITLTDLLDRAGLNWGTEARPMWRRLSSGKFVQDKKIREIYRTDNEDRIGDVKTKYENVTNYQAFAFGDELVKEGVATWSEGGMQNNGARVFASMRLAESFSVLDNDAYEMYLFWRMGHGSGMSITGDIIPFRAFCLNQHNLATASGVAHWAIPHLSTAHDRLAEAHAAVARVGEYTKELAKVMETLALKKITTDQVKKLIDEVVPKNRAKRDVVLADLLSVYETSETVAPYRGTAYGLLNAATEFYDHVIRRDSDNARFEAAMVGDGMKVRDGLTKRMLTLAA